MMLIGAAGAIDVSEELISTSGFCSSGLNRGDLSRWISTLPLSYPATHVDIIFCALSL